MANFFDNCDDILTLFDSPNSSLWVPPSSFDDNIMNSDEKLEGRMRANLKRDSWDGAFTHEGDATGGEECDPKPINQPEKKRKLTAEQLEVLDKSFDMENKLNPKRKAILAKHLGLKSKQVAVWFQNRRARYKIKQIEKEYDSLKTSYDHLKCDYHSLAMEKEKLQNEVEILKEKLAQKGNKEPVKGVMSTKESYWQVRKPGKKPSEDASSAKSDIIDYSEGTHNSTPIEASSGLVCGPEPAEPDQLWYLSADDEEHLMMSRNLLLPQTPPTLNNFLNLADDGIYDPTDDHLFWSWLD